MKHVHFLAMNFEAITWDHCQTPIGDKKRQTVCNFCWESV